MSSCPLHCRRVNIIVLSLITNESALEVSV
jgi:hypothetical protein